MQNVLSMHRKCGQLALRIAGVQILVAILLACPLWGFVSLAVAASTLLGGVIAAVGTLLVAAMVFSVGVGASPQRILLAFYLGEFLKLLWIAVAFSMVFILFEPRALALFACFALCLLVFWVALLSRALRGELEI